MELNTAKLSSAVADGVRKENGYKLCLEKCRQVSGKIISTQKKKQCSTRTSCPQGSWYLHHRGFNVVHYTKPKLMLAITLAMVPQG